MESINTATVRPRCRAVEPTLLALLSAGEIQPDVFVGLADQMDPPAPRGPLASVGVMEGSLAEADVDRRDAGAVSGPRINGEMEEEKALGGLLGRLSGRGALRRAVDAGAE